MKASYAGSVLIWIIFAAAAGAVAASEVCTTAPREQWKPASEAQRAAESLGYRVVSVKVDDGCYEVKGVDRSGKRVEIKFEPTELQMVSRKYYKSKYDSYGSRYDSGSRRGPGASSQ
jgi:hypothetical protein